MYCAATSPEQLAHFGRSDSCSSGRARPASRGSPRGSAPVSGAPDDRRPARDGLVRRRRDLRRGRRGDPVRAGPRAPPPRRPAAEALVAPYLWKTPGVRVIAVGVAAMHGDEQPAAQGALEAAGAGRGHGVRDRGALYGGLPGCCWGSFAGSVLLPAYCGRSRPGAASAARSSPTSSASAGSQAVFFVIEAMRRALVLRLMNRSGREDETGMLVTAMSFTLPLTPIPELLAQAL